MRSNRTVLLLYILCLFCGYGFAQTDTIPPNFNYSEPQQYEVGGIKVSGAKFSDANALIAVTGLKVGDQLKVPGTELPKAIRALWKLRLFTDVQILKEKSVGDIIFLEIIVQERPRYIRHSFQGVKKSKHDDLNAIIARHLLKGNIVTENAKVNAQNGIVSFYREKGYLDAEVRVDEIRDERNINAVRLVFNVDKKDRVKIKDITFKGNDNIKSKKLRKLMKGTRRKRKIFASSKLVKEEYTQDKKNIINYYNTIGFRDAIIVNDSIWRGDDGHLRVHINVDEGNRYFFRNITWKGNSIYDTRTLSSVLGIAKGDVYNQELLDTRLSFSLDGRDVSTLYLDNGYLFFRVDPVETSIVEDSIDLEIRIYEGPQATIDKVIVRGNDRTHEHVIRRELRTRPGAKFSRSDIIRSQREIINLGYFNPEALQINTPVNPQRGTVDIEYVVEEKPSDQLELSAGWAGGGRGVIGTLGVSFNNFSLRNIFNKEAWSPLPQGDGQRLSLRAQTSGSQYQSYNMSFTEPWLGGKKPTSFSVSTFFNRLTGGIGENAARFNILGVSIGLGTRLKFPDDNFISNTTLTMQKLDLRNYTIGAFQLSTGEFITDGTYYNISLNQTITRSTINDPIFPRSGSRISLSLQATLPYSLFSKRDYSKLSIEERFKFLEYHKWRFNAEWFTPLVNDKLVLRVAAKMGLIGSYNGDIGLSPFEQFQLGGDGFSQQTGQFYQGVDLISLRGYEVLELEANIGSNGRPSAAPIFDKFTVELRYPLSLNPSATIFVLAFAEGGNSWRSFRDFNPFDVKRSVGMGIRIFLPMFGTLGFDYGLGFDDIPDPGNSVFSKYGNFNIILGFEPE
ncbi:MAG: outer membrane protein assembly factor BamA [Bacteroidota bacterium]